jgi:hypothetical protein
VFLLDALLNVVDRDVSMRVSHGNPVLVFLGESTTGDTVFGFKLQFGILCVFQSPEAQKPWF